VLDVALLVGDVEEELRMRIRVVELRDDGVLRPLLAEVVGRRGAVMCEGRCRGDGEQRTEPEARKRESWHGASRSGD